MPLSELSLEEMKEKMLLRRCLGGLPEYLEKFQVPILLCAMTLTKVEDNIKENWETLELAEEYLERGSYIEHPLRRLYDAGAAVTMNTDNMVLSDVTLEEEYLRASRVFGFTAKHLSRKLGGISYEAVCKKTRKEMA